MSSTTTRAIARVVRLDRSRDGRRDGPIGDEPAAAASAAVSCSPVVPDPAGPGTRPGGRAARALPRPGPAPGRAGGRGPLGNAQPSRPGWWCMVGLGTEPREGGQPGVAGGVVEVLLDAQQLVVL